MDIRKLNEEISNLLNEDTLQDEVNKIINDNKLYYDSYITNDNKIAVEVDGDWKHDHAYFDNLMRKNGFIKDDEESIGDGDSDCYKSTHFYIKKSINEDLSAKANKLISTIDKKIASSEYGTSTILGVKNISRSDLESIKMYAEMIRDTGSFDGFMRPMGAEKEVLQKAGLLESINEIAAERYLSVEPIEGGFIPNTEVEYNANIVLYEGDKAIDQIMVPLYYDEIEGNKDDYIRGIAKDHFENITDDIRVQWF